MKIPLLAMIQQTASNTSAQGLVRLPSRLPRLLNLGRRETFASVGQLRPHSPFISAPETKNKIGKKAHMIANQWLGFLRHMKMGSTPVSAQKSVPVRIETGGAVDPHDLARAIRDLRIAEGKKVLLADRKGHRVRILLQQVTPAEVGLFGAGTSLKLTVPQKYAQYHFAGDPNQHSKSVLKTQNKWFFDPDPPELINCALRKILRRVLPNQVGTPLVSTIDFYLALKIPCSCEATKVADLIQKEA